MAVFQGKPRCVVVAQIVAIAITLLLLLFSLLDAILEYSHVEWYVKAAGIVFCVVQAVVIIAIVLIESRCLLLTALIVMGISIIFDVFIVNIAAIYFAVTVWLRDYWLKNPSLKESKMALVAIVLSVQFLIGVYFLIEIIRFYCILRVYRWAKQSHTLATQRAPQVITVRGV